MARQRTQKAIVRRIDRQYFRRDHPFRRWRRILTYGMAGGTLVAVVLIGVFHREDVYMNGPLAPAHRLFTRDCILCHRGTGNEGCPSGVEQMSLERNPVRAERTLLHAVDRRWRFWRDVSDAACLSCHSAGRHHAGELFTPRCAQCHPEHRGQAVLSRPRDEGCLTCHADLKTTTGRTEIVLQEGRRITDFASDHPEFAVVLKDGERRVRRRLSDPLGVNDQTALGLNHRVHLKPGLFGPERQPVHLTCEDCHQVDGQGAYMGPIRYERHCMACHLLEFDARFQRQSRRREEALAAYRAGTFAEYQAARPDAYPVVPHGDPARIRSFLQDRYAEYLLENPDLAKRVAISVEGRLPRRGAYKHLSVPARLWVDAQVAGAEKLLYRKTCRECHQVREQPGELPRIVKPEIPSRWFSHSRFRHKAHRELSCLSCHARASTSEATKDVLLPGIAVCRQCHAPGKAPADCAACHLYHEKPRGEKLDGPFCFEELTRGIR